MESKNKNKSLKRQNSEKPNKSKKKLKRKSDEMMDYYSSESNDDNNSNTENNEDDSDGQEDVFADLGGLVKQEYYSDDGEDEESAIKQVYVESHQNHTNSSSPPKDDNILRHIMIKLDRISSTNEHNFRLISAQNNEIIKQQISINNNLKMLEKRIQRIETKLQCEVKIDDFGIEVINNLDEFKQFLSSIQSDREFSSKCTAYLHKNCPKGSSKHIHYGVIKGIIDKLFSPSFKNICGWASEKIKKNSENPPTAKSNRVLFSEHHTFQKLILDVLNFNSAETFTMEHVVDGIKEYYKRFPRKVIDSENEGCSISSIAEELERRRERDRIRMQLKRQNETPEEREVRRQADAARQRRRRETEAHRETRLEAERIRQAEKRRHETEDARKARLERERIRQAQKRSGENEEERQRRLETERIRQAQRRRMGTEDENLVLLEEYAIDNIKVESY